MVFLDDALFFFISFLLFLLLLLSAHSGYYTDRHSFLCEELEKGEETRDAHARGYVCQLIFASSKTPLEFGKNLGESKIALSQLSVTIVLL